MTTRPLPPLLSHPMSRPNANLDNSSASRSNSATNVNASASGAGISVVGTSSRSSPFATNAVHLLPSTSTVIANHSALSPNHNSITSLVSASPRLRIGAGSAREDIRDIEKCGWIRLLSIHSAFDSRPRIIVANTTQLWAMFCVINEKEPVLELFSYKQALQHKPSDDAVHRFSLLHVQHVSPCIAGFADSGRMHEFAITLHTCTIRLAVPTYSLMLEWIDTLNQKLVSLHLLPAAQNLYSKEPVINSSKRHAVTIPSHYISRPLPPIPLEPEAMNASVVAVDTPLLPFPAPVPPRPARTLVNRHASSSSSSSPLSPSTSHLFNDLTSDLNAFTIRSPIASTSDPTDYVSAAGSTSASGSAAHRSSLSPAVSPAVSLSQSSSPSLSGGPLSLRESQVVRLQNEINHVSGVRLQLRQPNAGEQLALVDWVGRVFLAGWRQKHLVHLHSALHIGDQILQVSGHPVRSAAHAYSMIRSISGHVDLVIRRTPHASVFLIRRQFDRQPLGIERNGNRAEILYVNSSGLAAQFGVPPHTSPADSMSAETRVNWCITEINFRSLNLFYKRDEIHDRLNAVGREISLLLQPADLIRHLRKSLKHFKNYKEYLVQ